jgi:hypothetical protein
MDLDKKLVGAVRGRIEQVKITEQILPHVAKGYLANQYYKTHFGVDEVLVNQAQEYIGKSIIARFELDLTGETTIGNFIHYYFPKDFKGLGNSEYILLARWYPGMQKGKGLPTLDDINTYYDPGDMPGAVFLDHQSNNKQGRYMITPKNEPFVITKSIGRLLEKYLPNDQLAARVIIATSDDQLAYVERSIREMGRVPIKMWPKVYVPNLPLDNVNPFQ